MGASSTTEPASAPLDGLDAVALLNAIPGVVGVISPAGQILWINDGLVELTGWTAEDLIGTSMLDHLDLEWNPLALESIGYALDNPGMRLPTMLRFLTKVGRPIVMEATANNQIHDPAINGLVVHLRPSDERQLLDGVLHSFASGEPLEATIERVHDVSREESLRAESALVLTFTRAEDRPSVLASSAAVRSLSTLSGLSSPWSVAAATGEPVLLAGLDALPVVLRDGALDAGFRACWAYPLRPATEHIGAVLVFWRREEGLPEPSATMMAQRLVGLCELVLERMEHSRELQHAASHDPLTGLKNRARFFDAVDEHVVAGAEPLGVLYLDLDGFKPINDRWGHGHGDQVLRAVADRLQAAVRPGDTVARLGGDEFAVACPGAGPDELIRLADRLIAIVRAPITVDSEVLRVGTSVGLATAAIGVGPGDALVAAADGALIAAKATEKGTWILAPPLV